MKKQLQGIALILFGTLLCCADKGLNSSVFYNFSDFPFSLFGVLIGCIGLYFVFGKTLDK